MEELQLITDYIHGNLTEAERLAFEQKISENPSLKEAVEEQRGLESDLKTYYQSEFENNLSQWREEAAPDVLTTEETTETATVRKLEPQRRSSLSWLKYAAVLLLLLGPLAYFLSNQPTDLYAEYKFHPVVQNSIRGNAGDIFTDANEAYANKDFAKAANIYAEANPNLLKGNIHYGVSLMEIGKLKEARAIFNFLASQNSKESQQARYLSALTYIKEGNNKTAILTLQKIDGGPLFKRAQDLVKELQD